MIKGVIGTALHIAETAQRVKGSRLQCAELAERAVVLSMTVYDALRKHQCGDDGPNVEDIATLLCALEEIDGYITRQSKKSVWKRLTACNRIEDDVARMTNKLEDAVKVFHIQSSISVDHHVSSMHIKLTRHIENSERRDTLLIQNGAWVIRQGQEVLSALGHVSSLQPSYDGILRLYGRDDIILDEVTHDIKGTNNSEGGNVVLYRARIRASNQVVIVKRFPAGDVRYQAEIEACKKYWHPNIVQTLGFLRHDTHHAFIVKHADARYTVEDIARRRKGAQKIALYVNVVAQSAYTYLADEGFHWSVGSSRSRYLSRVVDESGKISLDLDMFVGKMLSESISLGDDHYHAAQLYKTSDLSTCRFFELSNDAWRFASPSKRLCFLETLLELWFQYLSGARKYQAWWWIPIPVPGRIFMIRGNKVLLFPPMSIPSGILPPWKPSEQICDYHLLASPSSPSRCIAGGYISYLTDLPGGGQRFTVQNLLHDQALYMRYSQCAQSATLNGRRWLFEHATQLVTTHNATAHDLRIVKELEVMLRTELVSSRAQVEACSPVPQTLYFFGGGPALCDDGPWGYWSLEGQDAWMGHSGHGGEFWGITEDDCLRWRQMLNGLEFIIDISIVVEYERLSVDEAILVEEIEQCRNACLQPNWRPQVHARLVTSQCNLGTSFEICFYK
ncbi:hypothetical protein A0H81_10881 [Grifola frondosa]|uniref:Mixed lineage kinase domain-containing protein n=1 Tax=Grifola frondosa TaxID=5627 RepID=A0A1C7LWF8_GRIFR|nr:hypothetical protein A0H81_10881 [Grifola frondosa]